MALTCGTKLGPYEIQSRLGAGGMGEVYRARDSRLERDVAIKVLPANLSADSNLRQRLEREAKAVSKLSHSHICTLHDIGHQDGVDFLVMEYLEGETLEQRLTNGPLLTEQTLRYGAQIADALARAHKMGITHRDLKPANIMLTKSGAKLMDFGLAKQTGPAPLANALIEMTVEQSKLTREGSIVGTFQYMAPEQLEGKEADARTDIFALGAVTYEMATGKPAFSGKSRASLIASILTTDPPPITQLQPLTPPALERVVKKCMAKDPDHRWQNAADLGSELNWILESGSQLRMTALPARLSLHTWKRWLPWALSLVLVIGVTLLSWVYSTRPESSATAVHLDASLPANISFGSPAWPLLMLSPDGKTLVFVGSEDGITRLYARKLDQWDAVPIRGTEGAARPFFSADGQWIAFSVGDMVKKVAVGGGPAVDVVASSWGGGSWGASNEIVYTRAYNEGLWKVSAAGGSPNQITTPDRPKGELGHWWPQILPDGDTVLFTAFSTPNERSRLVALSLKTGKQKTLIEGANSGRYLSSGHLIFSRADNILAVPFDLRSVEVTGAPVAVLEGVACEPQNGLSQFSVSDNGALAFLSISSAFAEQTLTSFDRSGKSQTVRDKLHVHYGLRLSPDGRRIAMGLREAGRAPDVWIFDLARGSLTPLTHGPASNFDPIWTRDGKRILYVSERPIFDIYAKSADGSGDEELVLATPNDKYPESVTPDGKTLLFSTSTSENQEDLWAVPLARPKEAKPFLATRFYESDATLSSDGRWVAYQSAESGRAEIYVRDFPAGGNRFQVSTDGGFEPVWAKNGKELFYRSGKKLISVPLKPGADFAPGPPKVVLQGDFAEGAQVPAYDVSPDGQHFYFLHASKAQPQGNIKIVLNWSEELKRLVPGGNH
jgi:serine/threonine protein kinase/Tol biopolymer transport system component